jgi:RHS repeat-associated protein
MRLIGANPAAPASGTDQLPGISNYFIGSDPRKWYTDIPNYARVQVHNAYPGIDLTYSGNQRQLEYTFTVAPGADPGRIRLAHDGVLPPTLDAQGKLHLGFDTKEVFQAAPTLYQIVNGVRRTVSGGFTLLPGGQVGFQVGAYDATRPLVIDPTINYFTTFLGGSSDDVGNAIAVDDAGSTYVTGWTGSTDFPTLSPFQSSLAGGNDVFVSKMNAAGTALLYSTYLGGSAGDAGYGIAVDSAGDAYVTGTTASSDFPVTSGTTANLPVAFVTKLNPSGNGRVYSLFLDPYTGSTYGSGTSGNAIAVDSSGAAYVTGYKWLSASAEWTFVSKVGSGGSVSYTYLFGTGASTNWGAGIAVDGAGYAYVTGVVSDNTTSPFPTTTGAFQTAYPGHGSAFVSKVSSSGSSLVYSTFLGGTAAYNSGSGIAVDSAGHAFITGLTQASNFPTTTGAYQTSLAGFGDAFVTELNSSGSGLVYSTYLGGAGFGGGTGVESGNGIALDSQGNAFVTGSTASADFPLVNPLQSSYGGGGDAFVAQLKAGGSTLLFSTFLGGNGSDVGYGIAVDYQDMPYVVGYTSSTSFPVAGALRGFGGGNYDPFVSKLEPGVPSFLAAGPLIGGGPNPVPPVAVTDTPLTPLPSFLDDCSCGGADLVGRAIGLAPGSDGSSSEGAVRYADGVAQLVAPDLGSDGFGVMWGQDRSWSNGIGYAGHGYNGTGWTDSQLPFLLQADGDNSIVLSDNSNTARYFDLSGGTYQPRFFEPLVLTHDTTNAVFVLTDTLGDKMTFWDFQTTNAAILRGRLKSYTDPDGNTTSVTAYTTTGQVGEVQRSNTTGGVTTVESYLNTYLTSGVNNGLLSNVTLRRQVNGGAWTTVRQVSYAYYDGTQSYGNAGDLMTAAVQDAGANTLDTWYYRYYGHGSSTGYVNGIKYAFSPQSYARLKAAYSNPGTATDTQVAPYADQYFEYDSLRHVTKETLQGAGGTSGNGLGTTTFTYGVSTFAAGYNSWTYKAVETLPDGSTNTVYSNYAGEVMLTAFTSGSQTWLTYHQYDSQGRLMLTAQPSAVTGYSESYADLLNNVSGNYQYLSDSSGQIQTYVYYTSTTATETTAGGALGYQYQTSLQQGELGTAILQSQTQYFAHSDGSGDTVYPVATSTVYRNTDGTGAETTSNSYTWFSGTTQAQSMTVSEPVVSASQNGPGTADIETTFFDVYGRPIWTKDADGFITYTAYDQATGAVVKTITDVDTTRTSDFTGLPSGWSTPSGGGLHLITQYQVDSLGRTTKLTDPNGNITYTVYNDTNYEVLTYPGWNSSTNTPTGPTQVSREDRPGSYTETLTMTATPHLTGGVPDGTEAISGLQTLSRGYTNSAAQLISQDSYFNLSSVTYSTAAHIGTLNVNYYQTTYAYDNRGRLSDTTQPTGPTFNTPTQWDAWSSSVTWQFTLAGDFNGDGKADIAGMTSYGQWWVALSSGSLFNHGSSPWDTTNWPGTLQFPLVGDFNGDGKADIAAYDSTTGNWRVGLSTGSSFTSSVWDVWNINVSTLQFAVVGDFNGDGKADIAEMTTAGAWWVALSNGSSSFNHGSSPWDTTNWTGTLKFPLVGDFNGDGKPDIAAFDNGSGNWRVGVSTGSSFTSSVWATWNVTTATWQFAVLGDYNGDGKADIAGMTTYGQWWMYLSNGSSALIGSASPWDANWPGTLQYALVGDYNSDGKADIAAFDSSTGNWRVGLSNGSSFTSSIWAIWSVGSGITWQFALAGDYNGIGKSDIAGFWKEGGQWWVMASVGTIYHTDYDALGRVMETKVGTSSSNLIQTADYVYDNNTLGGSSRVGDGNLTQVIEHPVNDGSDRITQNYYDWRDRLVASKQGLQSPENTTTHRPITYTTYDNLDEATEEQSYDGDQVTITFTNGVPNAPSSSLLRAQAVLSYDDQGRVYKTQQYSVNPSTGGVSTSALTTNTWYNHRSLVIKMAQPGGLVTKTVFDGAGRANISYTSDGGGDSTWSDATNVTGDNVLSQVETTYDPDGNVLLVTDRERNHDETTAGALGNATTAPKARVSYMASYFDLANRLIASVDVGTNGGSAYTRPSSVPSRSDTVFVTSTAYNSAGWIDTVTDPRNLVTKSFQDNLGRTTKSVAAYDGGAETSTTNVATEYTYDASGHTLFVQADLVGGAVEQTHYLYGVTMAGGSGSNSNDILAATQYPDPTTGNASNSQHESYTANALGQLMTKTDRNGNVHSYVHDVLGRQTSDQVTTLGSGVDGSVRRIDTAYDTQGNPYLVTSYATTGTTTIVNQVQRAYNGLGQLITEYQSHSGAVNTSTTPKVQYTYSEMAGGANHSRPTSLIYPGTGTAAKTVSYNYASGLDDSISRLTSLTSNSVTLESYSYLGLGTVVKRAHPQTGIDLTYIKQTGESNGDAGDQYIGLDRFGRVVDQRWLNSSTSTTTDRFQYGFDRDGNVLYSNNLVNSSFSELYHTNGASNGYDSLNQLSAFARGTLSDTNSDGIPDTVVSPSHSQSWNLDAAGNFNFVTTDGTSNTRLHNKQNEITALAGASTPSYDANGNTTGDDYGKTLVYDAWNRLVAYKSGATTLESFQYDGLSRRIVVNPGTATDLYYSSAWQVLEEQVGGVSKVQYVWSPVYVDALVLRDRDADGNSSNGLEERLYAQQNANWNVTALVNTSGTVVERYDYDPYGKVTFLNASWSTLSGSAYAWVYLFQGGRYDATTGLYNFRNRDYSPTLSRWMQNDPLGYAAGDSNLYRTESNNSLNLVDPFGLVEVPTPQWIRDLVGVPGGAGERGTIAALVGDTVNQDFSHVSGAGLESVPAHYDVPFIDQDGKPRTQRFHRDGHKPFTEVEHRAMQRSVVDDVNAEKALARQRREQEQRRKGRKGGGRGARALAAFQCYEVIRDLVEKSIEEASINDLGRGKVYSGTHYVRGKETYVFQDEGGRFIISRYDGIFSNDYRKEYLSRTKPGAMSIPISSMEYDYFQREVDKRWGYMRWNWSNWEWEFVPGSERKSLPVISPNGGLGGGYQPPSA